MATSGEGRNYDRFQGNKTYAWIWLYTSPLFQLHYKYTGSCVHLMFGPVVIIKRVILIKEHVLGFGLWLGTAGGGC